ncbi:hypothetical protein SISSUDRAFT_1058477 [Sistotremastrum suecicum HHB10207 ss-3]|uniref:Uncharacterized protein n=1 Tax=Sistotremastrum suecicum HHB10207 ss-3 TaxID=1314776 RepID=A0A166HH29_9AGAM|nr:hypothetical protein SISSUDRAFT_1058477 [Sistotremastrum suecicum HHB10207 ss-3]
MPFFGLFKKNRQPKSSQPSTPVSPSKSLRTASASSTTSTTFRESLAISHDVDETDNDVPTVRAVPSRPYSPAPSATSSSRARPLLAAHPRPSIDTIDSHPPRTSLSSTLNLNLTSSTQDHTSNAKRPTRPAPLIDLSTDTLLQLPPTRASIFSVHDERRATQSTESLRSETSILSSRRRPPTQPFPGTDTAKSTTTETKPHKEPKPKRSSVFHWARDRSKSVGDAKSPRSEADDDNHSFQLKSFRHILSESPTSLVPPMPSLLTESTSSPVVPTRTGAITPPPSFQVTSRTRVRGDSGVSDISTASQKVTVGAFRQAARRSATNLPLASPTTSLPSDDRTTPPLRRSGASASPLPEPPRPLPRSASSERSATPPLRPPRAPAPLTTRASSPFRVDLPMSASPTEIASSPSRARLGLGQPSGNAAQRRTIVSTSSYSTSSEEEDEDEEDDEDFDPRAPGRIERKTTITQKSAISRGSFQGSRSEIGHGGKTSPRVSAGLPPSARSEAGHGGPMSSSFVRSSVQPLSTGNTSSVYLRSRNSQSTSALTPTASNFRQSSVNLTGTKFQGTIIKPPASQRDSDTSEDEDDEGSSEEDVPLSAVGAKRPPSVFSTASSNKGSPRGILTTSRSHTVPVAPLVDLKGVRTPPVKSTAVGAKLTRNTSVRSTRSEEDLPKLKNNISQDPRSTIRPVQLRDDESFKVTSRPPRLSSSGQRPSSTADMLSERGPRQTSMSFSAAPRPSSIPMASGGGGSGSPSRSKSSLQPVPPMRPFARRESPASSTGDSSSGKLPLTPQDGSELGIATSSTAPSKRSGPGHAKRSSVSFVDDSRPQGDERTRGGQKVSDETRRRDRRRSEAKAAIELGNVINGPGPIDDGEDADPSMGLNRMSAMPPFQHPNAMWNAWSQNAALLSPQAYQLPSPAPGADAHFLAAHQQAMMIAKQTYQYAVAQQAMAAAGDEWERSSNVGFAASPNPFLSPATPWGAPAMFPQAPRSVYAGSVIGGPGMGWGSSSVYGENFGPSVSRTSLLGGQTPFPRSSSYAASEHPGPSSSSRGQRQRTKTGPSGSPGDGLHGAVRSALPPSSWKKGH